MMHTNGGHGCARTTMSGFLKTCCLLLSFFILVACGTTKPATIDSQLTKHEGYEQTRDGVRIYIRPLQDKNEIKKYFGANLLKKGILPIFVLTENKNEAASFLVEPADRHEPPSQDKQNPKADESAVSGTDYISAEDARKAVYEKDRSLEGSFMLAGPIFWLALLPAAMADYGPSDASKSLQQALITQSLRKQTLSPGKTEQGFVYYHLPPDSSSARNIGITLKATNIETQDVMYFRFAKEFKPGGK